MRPQDTPDIMGIIDLNAQLEQAHIKIKHLEAFAQEVVDRNRRLHDALLQIHRHPRYTILISGRRYVDFDQYASMQLIATLAVNDVDVIEINDKGIVYRLPDPPEKE